MKLLQYSHILVYVDCDKFTRHAYSYIHPVEIFVTDNLQTTLRASATAVIDAATDKTAGGYIHTKIRTQIHNPYLSNIMIASFCSL
jgi:hypothetical protein